MQLQLSVQRTWRHLAFCAALALLLLICYLAHFYLTVFISSTTTTTAASAAAAAAAAAARNQLPTPPAAADACSGSQEARGGGDSPGGIPEESLDGLEHMERGSAEAGDGLVTSGARGGVAGVGTEGESRW